MAIVPSVSKSSFCAPFSLAAAGGGPSVRENDSWPVAPTAMNRTMINATTMSLILFPPCLSSQHQRIFTLTACGFCVIIVLQKSYFARRLRANHTIIPQGAGHHPQRNPKPAPLGAGTGTSGHRHGRRHPAQARVPLPGNHPAGSCLLPFLFRQGQDA